MCVCVKKVALVPLFCWPLDAYLIFATKQIVFADHVCEIGWNLLGADVKVTFYNTLLR